MPPRLPREQLVLLVHKAQLELLLNQQKLANLVGSSLRTVQRWYEGRATPYRHHIAPLVVALHPVNPELAARIAAGIGESLETLGAGEPQAAPPLSGPAAPAPPDLRPLHGELCVAAAADALDMAPRAVRPGVLAAVERAKAAGLSIDDLLSALRPPAPAPPPPPDAGPRR